MQIITISRGSQSYGEEFARKLAAKLDYVCVGREEILEEATRLHISIGKLETAIIKPHIYSEELARELDGYRALAASYLCEKALQNNIVYHGRTGHLLLPGIERLLKIRVISDMESRINMAMQRLNLTREKAKRYVEQLDEDRKKWVKQFYNVDWDVSALYDFVINLSHVNIENATTAVCHLAQLPDFQATPATINRLQDLYLASKARLLLFMDKNTSKLNVKTRASNGIVYATYLGQELKDPSVISAVLKKLDEARQIVCTQAATNILWVQEEFDPNDPAYKDILGLAGMWDAAVEIMQLKPGEVSKSSAQVEDTQRDSADDWRETGIMEDCPDKIPEESAGASKIYEKLINDGSAGGKRIICGNQKSLLNSIDRSVPYRLIILDNLFTSKAEATRTRLLQEWSNYLSDNLKTPVLSLKEIRARYRFSFREGFTMVSSALLTALIVFLIFHFDRQILSFLLRQGLKWKLLATASVFCFVPLFAYLYSTFTRLFFKMIKFE